MCVERISLRPCSTSCSCSSARVQRAVSVKKQLSQHQLNPANRKRKEINIYPAHFQKNKIFAALSCPPESHNHLRPRIAPPRSMSTHHSAFKTNSKTTSATDRRAQLLGRTNTRRHRHHMLPRVTVTHSSTSKTPFASAQYRTVSSTPVNTLHTS